MTEYTTDDLERMVVTFGAQKEPEPVVDPAPKESATEKWERIYEPPKRTLWDVAKDIGHELKKPDNLMHLLGTAPLAALVTVMNYNIILKPFAEYMAKGDIDNAVTYGFGALIFTSLNAAIAKWPVEKAYNGIKWVKEGCY